MRYLWERETDLGTCSLTAHPDEYDAHPSIGVLTMDTIPRSVTSNRISVAFALAFGYYAGGVISSESPVSAELSQAVSDLWGSAAVSVFPVDYTPKALSYGKNTFLLNLHGSEAATPEWHGFGHSREFVLSFVPMSESFSSSFYDEELRVPTNAGIIVPSEAPSEIRILPYIAQAVLLAEDLDVGIIQLPRDMERTEKLLKVGSLLQTCGLSLKFAPENAVPSVLTDRK